MALNEVLDRWLNPRKDLITLRAGDHGGYHVSLETKDKGLRWLAGDSFTTQAVSAMARIDYIMQEVPGPWERIQEEK